MLHPSLPFGCRPHHVIRVKPVDVPLYFPPPGLKIPSWTSAFSVYSKALLVMGSVRDSEYESGWTKLLAQVEVSERWSQRSSRQWLSPAADWRKLFHLVTVPANRGKDANTMTHSEPDAFVYCITAEWLYSVLNLHSHTICCLCGRGLLSFLHINVNLHLNINLKKESRRRN